MDRARASQVRRRELDPALLAGWAAPVLSVAGAVAASGPAVLLLVMLIGFLPVATILWSGLLRPEGRPSAPASGEPSPGDRASDLTATILAFAVFILTASRSLADPSGWHASAISILESFSGAERGVPELAAIAVVLGPLALAVIPLQVAAAVTGDHGGGHRGRTWVWVAAAALLAAGVVTVLLLAP